jgi:coatomer subunit gamma
MSYAKKDEDADQLGFKLDRTSVFQDGTVPLPHPSFTCNDTKQTTARLFNSSPISPRRCRTLLTKIAVLLFTGEKFPTTEATTLFFGISKLFQNKDPSLRQMVYLILKELAHTAEDVIMSTSIIMKDGNLGSEHIYRANAIRALCRIIDVRSSHKASV